MDAEVRDHEAWRELVTLLPSGVLDQNERSAVRGHLRSCGACRDELIDLADVPGMLGRLRETPVELTPRQAPEPGLRDRLVGIATRERARKRRRRHLFVAAAVAVLVAVPLGLGLASLSDDGRRLAMTALPAAGGLTASALVDARDWGSAVTLQVDGDAPADRIKVVVWDRAGDREVAGWWGTDTGGRLTCDGATSFHADDVAHVAVQDADDEDLLTLDL